MSSFSKIAHDDALLISADLAAPALAPAVAGYEAEHPLRPIPSFWNFVEDDHAFLARSRMSSLRSLASSDQTALRS
ncbi:MAG: hypothetical protein JOZ74_05910 [Bradyrhizobium sp.]|nr:hypothetical protein [Bradyrhizobium sp.]